VEVAKIGNILNIDQDALSSCAGYQRGGLGFLQTGNKEKMEAGQNRIGLNRNGLYAACLERREASRMALTAASKAYTQNCRV
jgi:hypothetical protein